MKLKIFLKFTKIQYRIVKVHIDQLFRVGRFFFQILHCPIWRRFTDSGGDVMYLSPLSLSATGKKCDCNFSVRIKVLNF